MNPLAVRWQWLAWLAVAVSLPAGAHDVWLEVDAPPKVGSTVDVRIRVGEHFRGDELPFDAERVVHFEARAAHGWERLEGEHGKTPAARLVAAREGVYLIAYESTFSFVELEPARFEDYLRKESLVPALEERTRRGENKKPGREQFARRAKALVVAGVPKPSDRFWAEPIGQPLELVPQTDPALLLRAAGRLDVQLLFEGAPLPGAQVVAFCEADPSVVLRATTDALGRASLPLNAEGHWLIKSMHMVRCEGCEGADWESHWASLTLRAGPPPKPGIEGTAR